MNTPSASRVARKSLRGSTGQELEFFLATDGQWYMGLSDYPPDDDEEREYWDPEMEYYGPFPSKEAADKYLRRNFANPGGAYIDRSGRRKPPRKPINPRGRRWASDEAAKRIASQYLLKLMPDYGAGESLAALPRGDEDTQKEAKGRPHLNKEDPGSILGLLHYLLVDKHGLDDLAPDIKDLSRKVDRVWQDYRSSQ